MHVTHMRYVWPYFVTFPMLNHSILFLVDTVMHALSPTESNRPDSCISRVNLNHSKPTYFCDGFHARFVKMNDIRYNACKTFGPKKYRTKLIPLCHLSCSFSRVTIASECLRWYSQEISCKHTLVLKTTSMLLNLISINVLDWKNHHSSVYLNHQLDLKLHLQQKHTFDHSPQFYKREKSACEIFSFYGFADFR